MRTMIVGHGGRESVLGLHMAAHSQLYALMQHDNPSLVHYTRQSGGTHERGVVTDPVAVVDFARRNRIDLAMVSSDEPLAAGVVDALLAAHVPTVGPTKAGAQIEWDKSFSRQIVGSVAPECNPQHRIIHRRSELTAAFQQFGSTPVAVKPSGLTGGKGVKVMGPHLKDHAEARSYAERLLDEGDGGAAVILEEKIDGIEFTLQVITDGQTIAFPPPTYDYPYRFETDSGPGTGGMGSFVSGTDSLPFVPSQYYREASDVVRKVIDELRRQGRRFNGVLNSGFFLTKDGLRAIEFNARFGDPEAMNIMPLLDPSVHWIEVMQRLSSGTLRASDISFQKKASVVVYLVAPEYAVKSPREHAFHLNKAVDPRLSDNTEVQAFFASAEAVGDRPGSYRTVGASRALAVTALGTDLADARLKVYDAIAESGAGKVLEFRRDIGSEDYIEQMVNRHYAMLSA